MITIQKIRGAVFGAAVGDAAGVPYEFKSIHEMKANPATDMAGGGTYGLPAGTWSDDTSMILGTLDKLDNGLDYSAVMDAFVRWHTKGDYTPYGECFDIGTTTYRALRNYETGAAPLESGLRDERSNGNGSLMRIIPAALYGAAHGLSVQEAAMLSHDLSRLTHAHRRSQIGCGIFTFIAYALMQNPGKSVIPSAVAAAKAYYESLSDERFRGELTHYERIFRADFAETAESDIRSSGYVVTTLECALWCLLNTDNYRDCILKAVNFGADTDTAACVAGALAGLLYGEEGIPKAWRDTLANRDLLEKIIVGFCERNGIV